MLLIKFLREYYTALFLACKALFLHIAVINFSFNLLKRSSQGLFRVHIIYANMKELLRA